MTPIAIIWYSLVTIDRNPELKLIAIMKLPTFAFLAGLVASTAAQQVKVSE